MYNHVSIMTISTETAPLYIEGPIHMRMDDDESEIQNPVQKEVLNSLCLDSSDDDSSSSFPVNPDRGKRIQSIVTDAIGTIAQKLSESSYLGQEVLDVFRRHPDQRGEILAGAVARLRESGSSEEDSEEEGTTYILAEPHRPSVSPSLDSRASSTSTQGSSGYLDMSEQRKLRSLQVGLKAVLEEIHVHIQSIDNRLNGTSESLRDLQKNLRDLSGTPKVIRLLLDVKSLEAKMTQARMIQEEIYVIRHGRTQAKIAALEDFASPEAKPVEYQITLSSLRENFELLKDRFGSYYSTGTRHFM